VVAGAGGIVVALVLLRSVPAPVGTASPLTTGTAAAPRTAAVGGRIPTPTDPGFPSPPQGATVLAREAGTRALGLALLPGAGGSLLRVSVLSGVGPGAAGLDVSVRFAGGAALALPACGAGCYQATVPSRAVRSHLTVRLGSVAYPFTLPASLHLPDGTAIVARATAVWNALKTLVWHERLAASPTDALHTVYRAVAPDELSYTIADGSAAVIIGHERWDRSTPTGRWVRSPQDPAIRQPLPFWVSETDVRVLGAGTVAGQGVWVVSFFDPETPGWFEARISKRTYRTLELSMIAVAHFMHHVYGPFDAPFRLHPP
jgi:hypothetical protein